MVASIIGCFLCVAMPQRSARPAVTVTFDDLQWYASDPTAAQVVHHRLVFERDRIASTTTSGTQVVDIVKTRSGSSIKVTVDGKETQKTATSGRAYDGFTFEDVNKLFARSASPARTKSSLLWCPWFETKESTYVVTLAGKKHRVVRLEPALPHGFSELLGPVETRMYELDGKGVKVRQAAYTVVTSFQVAK